ncbi:hypothetical protein PV433_10690 [Paenibacillus sp. GYB004]|uniref:hypothetical protein n=1 Tax=Paenibacillus sp. GYB004 TaxID=2994393 RepID=UPI002F96AA71
MITIAFKTISRLFSRTEPVKEFNTRTDGYEIALGAWTVAPGGMQTPIQPHIGADRLAVRDLDRAAERYDRLLDLNVKPAKRFDRNPHIQS